MAKKKDPNREWAKELKDIARPFRYYWLAEKLDIDKQTLGRYIADVIFVVFRDFS
jgi:hypothetical protein